MVVQPTIPVEQVAISTNNSKCVEPACVTASSPLPFFEPSLPFADEDVYTNHALVKPAAPLLKTSILKELSFKLPGNKLFIDRILPPLQNDFTANQKFPADYFSALHSIVNAASSYYPEGTPNHRGARVPLQHTGLNMEKWRSYLIGYNCIEICQYLEFGFPIGLQTDPNPELVPSLRNHSSAYQYFKWIDEFIQTGLSLCDLTGPWQDSPYSNIHTSPLMTAIKKPDARRPVFDATYGDSSLNNLTPSDNYLGMPIDYAYPKIEDFKRFVVQCGRGSFVWKRDLSRYFLQIPLDPLDYPKVGFVWRGYLFFFCGLMFGLKHSGLQGQRVTTAVTWIHNRLGLETDLPQMYNSLNYSDDFGGCESTEERALKSFNALGSLLEELGLKESSSKACPPSTCMPYLGVEFDTREMVMRVPAEKITEIREELSRWRRKTTATKRSLQQLLGRLFWVSRCIKFSRVFLSRLLAQLKSMHSLPDQKKSPLSEECKLDVQWWDRYVRRFNGTELIYPTDPLHLSLDQLLETSAAVNCGDAQPMGGGSYYGSEYWSRTFPLWLQDPLIPIHVKEFWVVLASAWLWGEQWRGKLVYIFCDNVAVVESLQKEKPSDPVLQDLVREYLYVVCTRGFTPVFRRIGTKANEAADFISRRHDPVAIASFFKKRGLPMMNMITAQDNLFTLRSNW